ncbi:homeobox-domain-containing protein [Tricholoma matsutake]|nr:homeobox-domain-containing protein [Tricholoma matsutake 945]
MSKSRSATPKPNTFPSVNISQSTESTTSRPRLHENTPSGDFFEGRERQLALRPVSPHSFHRPQPDPNSHASSSSSLRLAETSADQPMSKRIRRESPQRRQSSTSPSDDSQDEMADTGTDTSRNQQSEAPQPPAKPQPKKKRTRTLTTPHQSAVLHALLAQSRFPTTAMREEVGRSIGLSARKVQIWFQNQRQKARRPRSQSDTSRPPPQYGSFPPGSDPSPFSMTPEQGTSSGITQLGHARARGFEEDQATYTSYLTSSPFIGTLNSPSQLSGPGMPGADYRTYQERPRTASVSIPRPDPSSSVNRPYPNRTPQAHAMRPATSLPSPRPRTAGRLHDREFSRTLPPLNFGSSQSRGGPATGRHSTQAPSYSAIPAYHFSRPSTPELSSLTRQPLESFSRSAMVLPPPFTLQPTPQWDNSLSTPLRLEPLAGPRLCPLRRSNSPIFSPHTTNTEIVRSSLTDTTLPSRSGRYDPVRATFVHTTSPSPPPSLAQETGGGGSDVGDDRERP